MATNLNMGNPECLVDIHALRYRMQMLQTRGKVTCTTMPPRGISALRNITDPKDPDKAKQVRTHLEARDVLPTLEVY